MYSDNKFGRCCACPAMMSDRGRLFTNYLENVRLNNLIKHHHKIYNNHDYRLMLQKHGLKFILNERSFLEKNKRCHFDRLA
jgi:hypothetical protein